MNILRDNRRTTSFMEIVRDVLGRSKRERRRMIVTEVMKETQ